jgi:RNA polymerase sigma-70 factor (ECF subfamily)
MAADEDLVGDLAHGDERALRELLRRYQRPLSSFIYRHTGGRDVEDLYQETWLRVLRGAARFDRAKRFSTWLFQIAVNLCRDWHRRAPVNVNAQFPANAAATARELERSEAALDAARLLMQLPEPQREVLILRFYHDLTEEEVATVLDCPKGTVKSRLHNALVRLAALVREEER